MKELKNLMDDVTSAASDKVKLPSKEELLATGKRMSGDFTSTVFDGVKKGTEFVADGARNLYQRGLEDREKHKEIQRIYQYCKDAEETLKNQKEKYARDFEREQEVYNGLIPRVNDQLKKYQDVELLAARETEALRVALSKEDASSLREEVETSAGIVKNSIFSGGVAGLSAGAGVVGLMTMLGTAGTGTALSSLSGAAYISATLAALGGGPLYAGGAGMMGGTIVLGAAVLAPAAAVAGYLADKKINEAYPKALECEAKVLQMQKEAEIFFRRLEAGISQMRQLTMELYSFSGFFDELLNMSAGAMTLEHEQSFLGALRYSANVLHSFSKVRLLRNEKELNEHFEEDFERLRTEEQKCKGELDAYRRMMDPEHQQLLDRCKTETLKVSELEKKLAAIRERLTEYKRMAHELRQELSTVTNEKSRLERVEAFYQEKLEEMASRQPEALEKIVEGLDERFHDFGAETLRMLGTGEFHYQQNEDITDIMDFGGVAIEYGKSLERILTAILRREGRLGPKEKFTIGESMKFVRSKRGNWALWVRTNLEYVYNTRNKAAHQDTVLKGDVRRLRSALFDVDDEGKECVLEYLHRRLR